MDVLDKKKEMENIVSLVSFLGASDQQEKMWLHSQLYLSPVHPVSLKGIHFKPLTNDDMLELRG